MDKAIEQIKVWVEALESAALDPQASNRFRSWWRPG